MSYRPLPTPLAPEAPVQLNELDTLRSRILRLIQMSALVLGGGAYFLVLSSAVPNGLYLLAAVYTAIYLFLLFTTLNKKLSNRARAVSFTLILFALGTTSLLGSGFTTSVGLLLYTAFVLLTSIMIGSRSTIIAGIIALGGLIAVVIGTRAGWLPITQLDLTSIASPLITWIINIVIFASVIAMVASSVVMILGGLGQTLRTQKQLTDDIAKERGSLEKRVEERTVEIQKRAAQQQAASQVARAVSTQTNLDNVLNIAISQIQNRFGYYHAGIFLVDEKREFAVLRAATSEGGKQMIANNHRLRVGEEGIVGYVTAKGEPRIAVDVGLDATHFQNPYLPDTRSEIALPLRSTSGIIGALDVQSREETAFTREDLDILQTIADQLAAAIEHSITITTLQTRIEELDSSYRKITQKSWQDFSSQTRRHLAFQMQRNDTQPKPIEIGSTPQILAALKSGETVMEKVETTATSDASTLVAVPIKLREQVIGVINLSFKSPTITQDTRDMLETSAARLAVALENVRLLDEVQTRAEREHLVGDLSSKIRSTSEIDHILRTTAEELGRILGVSQVTVQLRKDKNS